MRICLLRLAALNSLLPGNSFYSAKLNYDHTFQHLPPYVQILFLGNLKRNMSSTLAEHSQYRSSMGLSAYVYMLCYRDIAVF